jgi:hypothetical protein
MKMAKGGALARATKLRGLVAVQCELHTQMSHTRKNSSLCVVQVANCDTPHAPGSLSTPQWRRQGLYLTSAGNPLRSPHGIKHLHIHRQARDPDLALRMHQLAQSAPRRCPCGGAGAAKRSRKNPRQTKSSSARPSTARRRYKNSSCEGRHASTRATQASAPMRLKLLGGPSAGHEALGAERRPLRRTKLGGDFAAAVKPRAR